MNQKDVQLMAAILRELASQIEALRVEDVESILTGAKRFDIRITSTRNVVDEAKVIKRSENDLFEAIKTLHEMKTREEGERFLREKFNTKADLVLLAKAIDVPVYKTDTVEMVAEKIVEATIGFRTRSAAVQGGSQ